jgi:hypothetical protein
MKAGKVIIYVEGPSDQAAMEALLKPLIEEKSREGVVITFSRALRGDRKRYILLEVPKRAVDIIVTTPYTIVVGMPDLYPRNKGFKHETFDELKTGILRNFSNALRHKGVADDPCVRERFRVFCLKYDLEALVLASQEALRKQLGIDRLKVTWRIPVEDQDHDSPPRHIVERLFKEHGQTYKTREHAPLILGASDYRDIAEKCPQCFRPFVEFLSSLEPAEYDS